ncbi:relaxase/mobilization nuclease domain-containing protein [Sphingobium chungangianum]
MTRDDHSFRPRLSGPRDSGARPLSFMGEVRRAAAKAGFLAKGRAGSGTGWTGRGARAGLPTRANPHARRVIIKARIVRHKGLRFRAAPMSRHLSYLQREGVSQEGQEPDMFDATGDGVDTKAFAQRCAEDRHHFRFILSPEDAAEMDDLRGFTRDLMADVASDLDTRLDWIAIDHWNTDNPHVHILLRGVAEDGTDLVIDRSYIREDMRLRAQNRVTLELGPRSDLDIAAALDREVGAEHWTSLDRRILSIMQETAGLLDLRQQAGPGAYAQRLIGRAMQLEKWGLAEPLAPACWSINPDLEATLRELGLRGDVIKTMHRTLTHAGRVVSPTDFALHEPQAQGHVMGRLAARGLADELSGSAFAIVEGVDGRTHYLRFSDLAWTGDAPPGAIVELRRWEGRDGRPRSALAVRSDLTLGEQISARGATWLDRQLIGNAPLAQGGFGGEVRVAMAARADHLINENLAWREAGQLLFSPRLLAHLRERDLTEAAAAIAKRSGLSPQSAEAGELISGTYRERVTLASGRFAMIDDGMGFQLVPWRPALDGHLGEHVAGTMRPAGGVEWTLGRSRSLSL